MTATAADVDLEFVTKKEAAEIAHASEDSVGRWLREGKLTRYGTPGRVLIHTGELRDFLAKGTTRRRAPGEK